MLNLDHQTATGSQFFHRSDVAMAPAELNLSYPFSLSVERHKQDSSHIVQEIEGESIDGHKLRAVRNGKKGIIRSPVWGGWIVSIIPKEKEAMNLNNVTETGIHFIDRNDVTNAPAELITAMPFKLTVTNPKFENVATQAISGTDHEGRAINCVRKGWKQGILGVQWDNWQVEYITQKGEAMNVKAMTDAEIEMNLSRLWAEQTERTIKKVMGAIPGPDIAGIVAEEIAKLTTAAPKPEPSPVSDMKVVINNVPQKVDLSEAFKRFKIQPGERTQEFKRPEPIEFTIKMDNEQEFNELMAEIAEQGAGHIMPIPPLSEEGIEKAAIEAHLAECKGCRIEHVVKLGYALLEINQLIAKHTHPDAIKALEKEKQGIQREINKYMAS